MEYTKSIKKLITKSSFLWKEGGGGGKLVTNLLINEKNLKNKFCSRNKEIFLFK